MSNAKQIETDLRNLIVGQQFVRKSFPRYGQYVVLAMPEGSIGIQVRAQSGRIGELLAWERVVPTAAN
jgi:hypothetical protein